MKLFFGHSIGNSNLGDKVCCPIDYYDFPYETERIDVAGIEKIFPKIENNVLIYGGGGLLHLPSSDYRDGHMEYLYDICNLKAVKIAWGVGHNIHHKPEEFGKILIEWPQVVFDTFGMIGGRDGYQSYNGYTYVPCVSCKHKLFQNKYKVNHDLTLIIHFDGIDLEIENLEKVYAEKDSFEKVIETIATGKTLITNSYYGAYWGMLLGKKVVVWKPFSTKFLKIHENIQFAFTEDELQEKIKLAKPDKKFLNFCVTRNDIYHAQVLQFLAKF
jgi:hypothetical protein